MRPSTRPLAEFERAVLLAVLRLGDAAYGVAIRGELQKRLRRDVSFGAVYTTLDRLLEKRMVSTYTGDPTPERGGRAKKFFKVEPRGVESLEHARRASDAIWSITPLPSRK
ncbi:MAG: PadR family transcriptional regulator [Thermoanaerobaculia bacterium]